MRRRLLAESGDSLGFRHPLIRAALYDEMPAPVRAAWHRDVGHALAEAGAPPDRVARQMLRAVGGGGDPAEPMDEWMLDWLARTADPLVGQAPGWRRNSSPGPSPAPQLGRSGAAGSKAGSLMPFSVSVIRRRPSRWRIAR